MSVYVGIDVHRKRSQVAVVNEVGEVLANRNVPNGVKPVLSVIGGLPRVRRRRTRPRSAGGGCWSCSKATASSRTWCTRCSARRSPRRGWPGLTRRRPGVAAVRPAVRAPAAANSGRHGRPAAQRFRAPGRGSSRSRGRRHPPDRRRPAPRVPAPARHPRGSRGHRANREVPAGPHSLGTSRRAGLDREDEEAGAVHWGVSVPGLVITANKSCRVPARRLAYVRVSAQTSRYTAYDRFTLLRKIDFLVVFGNFLVVFGSTVSQAVAQPLPTS